MASSDLAATLRFLTDAGHILATAAPETSAYLLSQRNGLMFEHEMPLSDKQREHVCTCCGHIMLPGQGSNLRFKQKTRANREPCPARRSKLKEKPPSGPTKTVHCGHCSRTTEIRLPPPDPIPRRSVKAQSVSKPPPLGSGSSLPQTPQEALPQKTSANASSKKRAKTRKAGLQALLDQSNAARNTPGLGLSLADFMEKK